MLILITGGDLVYIKLYADVMLGVNAVVLYFLILIVDLINRSHTSVIKKVILSFFISILYILGMIGNFRFFISENYIFIIILTILYSIPCSIFTLAKNYVIINITGCMIYGVMSYVFSVFDMVNICMIIISMFIVYIFVKLFIYYTGYRKYYRLKIFNNNKSIELKALLDSGNLLVDTITGKPVIIAEGRYLANIMGNSPLRRISYKSLGNDNGYLNVFRADSASVNNRILLSPIIAVYDTKLSDNGKYNAIIGLKHLGGK